MQGMLPTQHFQTHPSPGMVEISYQGKSYFVTPLVAEQMGNQMANKRGIMQPSGIMQPQMPYFEGGEGLKELSIAGKSYFIDPVLANQIAHLPEQAQLAQVGAWNRDPSIGFDTMPMRGSMMGSIGRFNRMGVMGIEEDDQQEISIGGKSYMVTSQIAEEMVGLPESAALARLNRMGSMIGSLGRFNRMGVMGIDESDQQEISIGGKSYMVTSEIAKEMVGLPESVALSRLNQLGSMVGSLDTRLNRIGSVMGSVMGSPLSYLQGARLNRMSSVMHPSSYLNQQSLMTGFPGTSYWHN